jgi:glycosyltransferase involved in cell wall biosynthesis
VANPNASTGRFRRTRGKAPCAEGGADKRRLDALRVALDVTPAVTAKAGLARYTEQLWRELARRDDVDVHAFALGRGPDGDFGLPLTRRHLPLRALRPLWRALRWPRAETFAGEVDVVHTIALTPIPTRRPQVVTIHDLLPITHAELYPPGADRGQRAELAEARRARVVVTTCEATADEIVRVAGFPRERIVIARPGVLPPSGDAPSPVEPPFVLAVGQVTPRKGFDLIAEAAALLGGDCPPVVLAGPDWWRSDDVRRRIAEVDVHRRVRFLGPVDDATLAVLYRAATVVCHASRGEGFGMTCLEAMAFGAAVVATDLPPIRELAAGAVELVPVDDAAAFADALRSLLEDETRRQALGEAARSRADEFSWERMAAGVVDAYRLALA